MIKIKRCGSCNFYHWYNIVIWERKNPKIIKFKSSENINGWIDPQTLFIYIKRNLNKEDYITTFMYLYGKYLVLKYVKSLKWNKKVIIWYENMWQYMKNIINIYNNIIRIDEI